MADYKYDLPTASPLDDYPQWVGLVWAAINTHLDHPYAWGEADANQAQQYIDDLYSAILLPPPSSGGGIVRLLIEDELTSDDDLWKIYLPDPDGVQQLRIVFTGWHVGAAMRNLRVKLKAGTGSWYEQTLVKDFIISTVQGYTTSFIDVRSVLPGIDDDPDQPATIVIDVFNPEKTDEYKQFMVAATHSSIQVKMSGVLKHLDPADEIHISTTGGDVVAGSRCRIYGFY